MFDALTTTQILAALIGLYFVAGGIGLLADRASVAGMLTQLKEQPLLGYLAALIAFAMGGAMVAVHNDWSGWLAGFVSFIGWVALLEGVLMLAARNFYISLFERFVTSDGLLKGISVATVIVGLALLGCVFL